MTDAGGQEAPFPGPVNALTPSPAEAAGSFARPDESLVEEMPPIDENSDPNVIIQWMNNLDRSDAVKYGTGLAAVVLIVAAWRLKKKVKDEDLRTPDGQELFIATNIPHASQIVSIGQRIARGKAVSMPRDSAAEHALRQGAKDDEQQKKAPVSKLLFALHVAEKSMAYPLEDNRDIPAYKTGLEQASSWLGHIVAKVSRKKGDDAEG